MSMIGQRATWHTWDDATGERLAIPVTITGQFYEPGDPVIAYNLRRLDTGEPVGGICSSTVTLDGDAEEIEGLRIYKWS